MSETITAAELLGHMRHGTTPLIVDVRSRVEFLRGHVPGAIHVPFWKLLLHPRGIPAGPSDPIVMYCGHGPRATIAAAALRRHGFQRIAYLAGHMAEWVKEGFPVDR